MQKFLTYTSMLVAIIAMGITFTACGDDPVEEPEKPTPDPIIEKNKDLSPKVQEILANSEGKYIGELEDKILDIGSLSSNKNAVKYRSEATVKKQSNGLYSISIECDGHNIHLEFNDCDIDNSYKDELVISCHATTYKQYNWYTSFKVDSVYNVFFSLIKQSSDQQAAYWYYGKKSLPESDVLNKVSTSVNYADFAYNIEISTSLANAYPGRTIKYGVECGYGSYDWQQWATGSGTNYSIACCVFVHGQGSPYANEGFLWKSYMNLKGMTSLSADQRELLADATSILKASESKAKSQFQGRVFVDIDDIRYYILYF